MFARRALNEIVFEVASLRHASRKCALEYDSYIPGIFPHLRRRECELLAPVMRLFRDVTRVDWTITTGNWLGVRKRNFNLIKKISWIHPTKRATKIKLGAGTGRESDTLRYSRGIDDSLENESQPTPQMLPVNDGQSVPRTVQWQLRTFPRTC